MKSAMINSKAMMHATTSRIVIMIFILLFFKFFREEQVLILAVRCFFCSFRVSVFVSYQFKFVNCPAKNVGVILKYYFLLFIANINAEEIIHITKAPMISELFFCKIPIKKSPTIITKKKIYAIVSIGIDFLNVAKPKIKPRANCRAAHI